MRRKPPKEIKPSIFENGKGFERKLQQAQKRDEGKVSVQIDNRTIKLVKP